MTVGPVIEMFELEGTRERRLVIGYRQLTSTNFFSALSDLYHFYGLTSSRKYVEQFSNGITVIGIYLLPARNQAKFPPIESSIFQVLVHFFSLILDHKRSVLVVLYSKIAISATLCRHGHEYPRMCIRALCMGFCRPLSQSPRYPSTPLRL
jgi:hypothetical protein